MKREEFICVHCEAEYLIEHDQPIIRACPFCKEDMMVEAECLELGLEWDE